MPNFLKALCLLAIALSSAIAPSSASAQDYAPGRVDNGRQLDAYLSRCFKPPPGVEGSEITLIFSLDRDGKLRGTPRIAYSKLVGGLNDRKAFVAAALNMIANCTPVPMSEEFGAVAAGKLRALRLSSKTPPTPGTI